MAITRERKVEQADSLRRELAEIQTAFLVDFRGLDVDGATDLRRKLREQEASFRVVKNRIALRAVEELPLNKLGDAFVGQTAIAYTEGDVVGLAKALKEFAKEYETPQFKAGVVDGEPISIEEFEQLAELPGREALIGKALYLMQYPVSGFVTALSGILRGFVTALDQIRDNKEQAGEAAPAEGQETPESGEAGVAEEPVESGDAGAAEEPVDGGEGDVAEEPVEGDRTPDEEPADGEEPAEREVGAEAEEAPAEAEEPPAAAEEPPAEGEEETAGDEEE